MLAEDLKLPKRQANILRIIGLKKKIKKKKRDKGFQNRDMCSREEFVKGGNFPHTQKAPHRLDWGEIWNIRRKLRGRYSEGKTQKIHHVVIVK